MQLVWNIIKIFLYLFFGLILLLFMAGFFADPIAKRLLEKEVGQAGEGQYALQVKDVQVSLLRGNILLRGIRFETDTAATDLAPVVVAEADEFSAQGVSWLTFLLEKRLFIDKLYLSGLVLEMKARPTATGNAQEPFRIEQLDIYPLLKEHIHKLHLQDLALNDIDFTLINADSRDTLRFVAARLDVQSEDVLIDADKLMTRERTFYANSIDLDGEELQFERGGQHSWKGDIRRLKVITEEELMGISLRSLVFLQQEEGLNDTLLYVDLPEFALQDLNLSRLQEEETAYIRKIALKGLDLYHAIDTPSVKTAEESRHATKELNIAEFNLGSHLPQFANSIELDELEIDVHSYRHGNRIKLEKLQLSATDMVMDEQPAFAEQRFLHARSISSSVKQLELMDHKAGYHFRWDSLRLQATEGRGGFRLGRVSMETIETDHTKPFLNARIAGIYLDSLDTRRLDEGVLQLWHLTFQQPRLSIQLRGESTGAGTNELFFRPDLYPAIAALLHSLSIAVLEIKEGSFDMAATAGSQAGNLSIPVFDLSLQDVLLDSASAYADGRVLHTKDIRLSLGSLLYQFPDEEYALQLGAMRLSTAGQYFNLSDIHYFHRQNNKADKANGQLAAIRSQSFSLRGLDYQKLLLDRNLSLAALYVDETTITLQPLPDSLSQQAKEAESAEKDRVSLAALSLEDMLPGYLKSVSIEDLNVKSLNLRQPQKLALGNLNLQASGIRLDARTAFADKRFLHTKKLETGFDTLWIAAVDPFHDVQVKDFSFAVDGGIGRLLSAQIWVNPRERRLEKPWLEAKIPALNIPHINVQKLADGHLVMDHISLSHPELLAYFPATEGEETREQPSSMPDLYPLIEQDLKSLQIGSVYLEEGSLRLAGLGGSYFGMDIPVFNLQLQDIHIAKGNAFENDRVLHSRNMQMDLEQLTYLFPDKVYFLQLHSATLNTADKTLNANGLRYMYGNTYEKILDGTGKNDVYRMVNDKILAEGVDFQKLFKNQGLWAEKLSADGLNLYIYKDHNKFEEERIKPMPRDMVLNIEMPLRIKELSVEDASITYEEMAEGAEIAGLVRIDDLSVDIQNISNIRDVLQQEPEMELRARGRLMGEGYFRSQIDVPMLGDEKTRIRGSIDTLNMAYLNRISRYNSRIAIESGKLYKASWDFQAGIENSFGDFEVSYEDLQVQLSSKDSPDTTGVLKNVGSFLVNLIVVDSNIAEGKNVAPKKVKFEKERDKQKSFFNYYVHSLLAGLMEAIGVPFQ
jgi:hypothetical protein